MSTLDLTPGELSLVRNVLANHLRGIRVVAFGSRVRGPAKPWSDLDLVIMSEDGRPDDLQVADVREAFEESDLPFGVDLSLWQDLPSTLQQIVRREGVTVQPPAEYEPISGSTSAENPETHATKTAT